MSNVLSEDKRQQVLALGLLGWSLRRIEEATGVRRETATAEVPPDSEQPRRPERALSASVCEPSRDVIEERFVAKLRGRRPLEARVVITTAAGKGRSHGLCFPRHTHIEFIDFLVSVDRKYRRREIHLICDNYGTHKHPNVRAWLKAHPRFHVHFTPTSASWLNLVERWFALLTAQAIRRGSFDSVRALERRITRFLANWNAEAKPFRWTKSARRISRQVRHVKDTYETVH